MKQGATWTIALILTSIMGYGLWGAVKVDAQEGSPAVYFNEDPVLLSRVRKFLDEEEAKRYGSAIGIYREVASYISSQASNRPYLYEAEDGLYLPVESYLRSRVIAFPPERIAAFLREADLQARPQWEKILRKGDVGALREFLRKNPLSSLVPRTVEALAGYHLERGEFDEALGTLGFLRRPEDWTAEARLIEAVALRATGQQPEGAAGIDESEPMALGGLDRSPKEILSELEEATPLLGWRWFGGEPGHSRVPEPAFDPGMRIATEEIPEPEAAAFSANRESRQARGGPLLPYPGPSSRGRPLNPYFPVHDEKRIILSDTFTTYCLDLQSGSLLWSHSLRKESSVPWGSPEAGHFPAASRDAVFVTLSPREAAQVIEEGEGDETVRKVIPGMGYRVMSLEITTGEILWDASKRRDLGMDLSSAAYVSSPLLLGDRLYLLVTRLEKEASASIISLNARTGDRIWETHLCTTVSPMILGKGFHGAYVGGGSSRIYASTNLGAVACLDAVSGGVLWIRTYDRYPAETLADLLVSGSIPPDEAPILVDGTVYAAPRDSPYLYALDTATGGVRWRFERAGENRLVGVRGETVILSGGGRALGIHGETGKVAWRTGKLPGELAGRPALAGDLLYFPTTRGLFLHRVSDGAEVGQFLWSHPDEEAGNIVFAADRMITVSPHRVNLYEDRGDTLKALAPLPQFPAKLGEGELLLRRGNAEKAVETLLEARSLAQGDDDRASVSRALGAAHRFLGDSARERGDLAAAASSYEAAAGEVDLEERIPLLLETGTIYDGIGSPGDATRLYRRILLESSKVTAATGRLPPQPSLVASARIRRRIEKEGRSFYEPYEREAGGLLAMARKLGNLDGFRKVVSAYPNSVAGQEARLELARIYRENGSWSLAAAQLAALLRVAPDSPAGTYSALARLYERSGRLDRARAVYKQIAALEGDSPDIASAANRLATWGGGDLPDVSLPANLLWRGTSDPSMGRMRILLPDDGAGLLEADLFVVAGSTGVDVRDRRTGLVRWSRRGLPHQGRQRIVLAGNRLFLPDPAGILAVDLASGDEIWKGPLSPEARDGAIIFRRLAASERHVVATYLDRLPTPPETRVFVLDSLDGTVLRSLSIPKLEPERTPILWDGKGILSLRQGGVALLDLEGDAEPMRYEAALKGANLSGDPIVDPSGQIHILVNSRKIVSLQPGDLSVMWEADYPFVDRMIQAPRGGPLILIPRHRNEGAHLRALNPDDGRLIFAVPVEQDARSGPIAIGPEAAYIPYEGGLRKVDAISLADGRLLWTWLSAGWSPAELFVTRGYLVAFVPDEGPPSRLVFINLKNGEEEEGAAISVPVDYRSDAKVSGSMIIAAGSTGIFGYGQLSTEALRRELAAQEEEAADPSRLAATRFALGQREEAIRGLSEAILREGIGGEEFQRLFEQKEGYRAALAEAKSKNWEVSRLYRPPEIDGDLKDWYSEADRIDLSDPTHISGIRGAGKGPIPWRGREDLSGRLYMGWDNQNFYFLLDIDDTYLRPYDSESKDWKGDCLLIAIDPKNDGGYSNRFDDILVTLALQAPRKNKDDEEERERNRPAGKYFVRRKDDNSGVIYEAAIPWKMFVDNGVDSLDLDKGPDRGFKFGFNPVVTDDDGEGGGARKVLSWTPGIRIHRLKDQLYNPGEIVPEYYGKIILK